MAAAQAQEEKPLFAGVLNGIRVYTPTDGKAFRRYCTKGAVESFRTTDRLTFGYLPPGTFAETPQYEGLCPDGSVAFIVQQFGGAYFGLTIAYEPGEHAVPSMASADRVSATTVGGRPALAIQPATPEGFGRSAVVVAFPTGLLKVEADGLPFAQTRKIAEGVRCERC
ncbi:MAG TPA: hypothetical protein VNN21_06725 [Dehalococcoidia bacterium]|nr:hypothetical protein [Dehalococcoidia bacterium]